jgi:hypothetical protein
VESSHLEVLNVYGLCVSVVEPLNPGLVGWSVRHTVLEICHRTSHRCD